VIIGLPLLILWQALGLLAWPFLLLLPRARRHMIRVPHPSPGRTWIHAASLGEHRAVAGIAPHLGPSWITSSSWRTPVQGAFPAPLDIPGVIGPWLNRARPGRIVLVEGELWPGWLIEARRRNIPISVVSARRGPGWRRWQWGPLKYGFRWLTRDVQFLYSEDWGDLKASAPLPHPALTFNRPTIIGASTREGDERALIHAWKKLPAPRPLLVLAPRSLNRVSEVESLTTGFACSLRSRSEGHDTDILILDTLGELAGLLPQAHIAFVGGTFDSAIGGHSPTEAAQAGIHIVHGPHTHANPSAWTGLLTTTVPDPSGLLEALSTLMLRPTPQALHKTPSIESVLKELPAPSNAKERYSHPLLWPLVPLWKLASSIQRMTQTKPVNDSRVLVVGGLVNGGAGRTPAAVWLAETLEQSIVLSAGYRRTRGGPSIRFGYPEQTPDHDLGDELEMIRRRGTPVISAPDRAAGIRAANGAQTIIIDGGIGDPRLCHSFRLICVDARSPTGGGPFPVGRARLPWTTLHEMDAIWVSNWDPKLPPLELPSNIPVIHSRPIPSHWLHRGKRYPLDALTGAVAVAVGIAEPSRFVCTLLDLDLTISDLRVVGDHRPLGALPSGCVVTEKDAARLPADADVWALIMGTEVTNAEPVIRSFMEHRT